MAAIAWVTWLCACVRYWAGRGLVYVCPCNYFSYFIFDPGMRYFTQTAIRLSYDSRYDNQGLHTKQLRQHTLDIFPALQEHLSMHQLKIGRAVNFALQVNFCHVI